MNVNKRRQCAYFFLSGHLQISLIVVCNNNQFYYGFFSTIRKLMSLSSVLTTLIAPSEIQSQRDVEKLLYERALKEGSVNVYRGRVLLVGQDRAGKTSLKKSLLGLPFNPKEQSTQGIEVDPSVCEIEVDQVKNWISTSESKPSLSEFSEDISRMLAEKQYNWIVDEAKKDSEMESELELTEEESARKVATSSSDMNQVCTFKSGASLKVNGIVDVN